MTDHVLSFDFTGYRIGDKCAGAWMLAHEAIHRDCRVTWNDPTEESPTSFPIAPFFPVLAERLAGPGIARANAAAINFGNVWLSAPKRFRELGELAGLVKMESPYEAASVPDVVIHCLADAPYNVGRNMDIAQIKDLAVWLHKEKGIRPFILPPPAAGFPARELLGIVANAKIFIGGDTGFSHAFGLMNPHRPLVWFGPDQTSDKIAFGEAWDSAPLSNHLHRFTLEDHKFNWPEVTAAIEKIL